MKTTQISEFIYYITDTQEFNVINSLQNWHTDI